jgi:hypothetical protein
MFILSQKRNEFVNVSDFFGHGVWFRCCDMQYCDNDFWVSEWDAHCLTPSPLRAAVIIVLSEIWYN